MCGVILCQFASQRCIEYRRALVALFCTLIFDLNILPSTEGMELQPYFELLQSNRASLVVYIEIASHDLLVDWYLHATRSFC